MNVPRSTTPRLLLPAVLLFALVANVPARAETPASLKFVPGDTAFYSASLRMGEQWDAVAKSKAYKKLMDMPIVQEGMKQLHAPGSPFAAMMKDKQAQAWLKTAGEMASREIFVCAGDRTVELLSLLQEVGGGFQGGRLFGKLQGGQDGPEVQLRILAEVLKENQAKIHAPDLLIGFRMNKGERADEVRKQVADLLGALAEGIPPLKGRVKNEKVGDEDFVVLTLDGSMVPWDAIPIKNIENEAGEFKGLIKHLKDQKLTISIGKRDDFILLAIGSSTDMVKKLGKGKQLTDLPEFKPLLKHADEKITSVGYVSKAAAGKMGFSKADADEMVKAIEQLLEMSPLNKEQRAVLIKDAKRLFQEIKGEIPEPGASLSYDYATERGSESWSYDWTKWPRQAEPKKLTLFDHVGGNPIVAVLGRTPNLIEDYRWMAKWAKTADGYIDTLLLPQVPEDERKHVEEVLKTFRPLVAQIDDVTQKMFLPAIKDGQSAFVLDAQLKSKEWIKALGALPKEMPLIEPVLILGVNDADLLVKAMGEYRKTLNKMIAAVKEKAGPGFPFDEIPASKTKKVEGGTIHFYAVAHLLGLDDQLSLSAAVGSKAAAFGFSNATTARMIQPTPFKGHGPLAKTDRPLTSAEYVNFEKLVKTLAPWAELAANAALDSNGIEDKKQREAVLAQVRTGLEILAVFRSVSSASYIEDKVAITHTETIIKDIE